MPSENRLGPAPGGRRLESPQSISARLLIGAALLALGGDAAAGVRSPRFEITLCDATGLQPTTLDEIQAEASAIFSSSGAVLRWHGCERLSGKGTASRREAWVFLLAEFPDWLADERGAPKALAHVFTRDGGRPGPVIYISRRAVAVTLGARRPHFLVGASRLSRAVGRVLAHELAHRFLGKASHSAEGVLRTSFHSRDLLDEDPGAFYFTEEQSENLQNLTQQTPDGDDSQR
jgi:hypothetical protein